MIRFMKVDGRKLSHSHLEEIRFEAVKAVQAGKSPSEVAREMNLYPNRVFVWLAMYRAGGWDALRSNKASGRPKRLTGRQLKWIYVTVTTKNPMQLQFVLICVVDTGNDTHADSTQVRDQAWFGLGGTTACSDGFDLPEAADPSI